MEVIVALVLLSSTGLALFAWISQSLDAASRLRDIQQASRLLDDARSLVDDVNPARMPVGQRSAGTLIVDWTSTPVEPLRDSASLFPGQPGPWSLGLYRLEVKAHDKTAGTRTDFSVLKVGFMPRGGIKEAGRAQR